MLNWAKDNECDLIISSSNIVNPQQTKTVSSIEYSIAVLDATEARNRLKNSNISLLQNGTIGGTPVRAAELSTAISRLVPGVSCNEPFLLREPEKIEKEITKIKTQDTESEMNAYG